MTVDNDIPIAPIAAVKSSVEAGQGHWVTLQADEHEKSMRLDKWLASKIDLSRARIRSLIESGEVRMDGDIIINPSAKTRLSVEYALHIPPPVDDTPKPEDIPLDILFEDDHLIVVHKPTGMTVHPAPGSRSGTLVNALLYHCKDSLSGIGGVLRPGIVHRIDKDTSGILVVAKTDRAHQYLSKQFAKHSTAHDRKKMAVVRGTFGDIDASEHGRHAVTNYKRLKGYGQRPNAAIGSPLISQIECRLETGRTHQIRVHMAHIGCPLLGDPLYGKQRAFKTAKSEAELQLQTALANLKRQALHAAELGFIHPISKEEMIFQAPLPDDLKALKAALEGLKAD